MNGSRKTMSHQQSRNLNRHKGSNLAMPHPQRAKKWCSLLSLRSKPITWLQRCSWRIGPLFHHTRKRMLCKLPSGQRIPARMTWVSYWRIRSMLWRVTPGSGQSYSMRPTEKIMSKVNQARILETGQVFFRSLSRTKMNHLAKKTNSLISERCLSNLKTSSSHNSSR